jgi:hypothetical protein
MNSKECIREVINITRILLEEDLAIEVNFPTERTLNGLTDIEFDGSKDLSIALRNVSYEDIHQEFLSGKRFNFQFPDGAFVQMTYRFNQKGTLMKHRLCYFPSPSFKPFQDDPERYEKDDVYADIMSKSVLPVPVRFDFDPYSKSVAELDHPKSHLTFGQYKNCRIPVISPLRPTHFIHFILTSFYKKKYDTIKGGIYSGFIKKMQSTATKKDKEVLHMAF